MVTPSGVKAGDGPAVLQLRNWSHLQLDLSEFSEVFISPTRELVLLLSYQCEALLLPLIAGAQSLPLYAPARTTSSGSDSLCISSCPREPIQAVQSNVFPDGSISSKHCHVISDVKSLAWGCCGDGYNQNLDAIFKELLVVSGDRGVTVHAFRCLDHDHEMGKPVAEEGFVQGKWVEWAPLDERSSSNAQASGSVWDADRSNEKEVSPQSEFVNHESPNRSFTSRTWLRTFLAEIETTESKGIFLTKFPEMSSFPSSAEVISFSISCSTPVFLDFLYRDNNSLSNISSPYIPYKCCKVFSSSSHRLIGMVMAFSGPISVETSERNAKSVSRVLVAVAMVYQWGIQWVSSIKLNDSYLREGPECEWTDFQFLDSFLVCLNRTGLIFIWGATTGKFVACLDVLRCCGIKSRSHIGVEQPKLSAESDDSHEEQKYQRGGGVCAEKKFRRLMVVSNSMLLAALDECGVIYVICVDDYVSKEHYSCNKTVTHFQHLGILASWEVAGSEIGGQKVFPDLLNCQCSNISWISNQDLPSIDGSEEVRIGKKQKRHVQGKGAQLGSYLSCFSRDSKSNGRCVSSETYLTPIRKIFLPPNGSNEVDAICFSPLGITRLVKRCNLEDQKAFRIVHMCLHVASTVQDDRRFCVLEKEQTFVGEAIGCSFQGYLYLVSQDGLSVVLPSIHLSSGILPVESIEYWRPSIITCSRYQMENLLAIKNSREMCQPWKIEILDRTLLYEGPDEADRICLENGWDLKITRMRRLQLALDYLKLDEIELSLEMLVDVNLAEEGIMRLLFTAVHHVFCQIGGDNELAMASRFLALAARFATKMVRRYGLLEHKRHMIIFQGVAGSSISPIQTVLRNNKSVEVDNSGRLHEMAYFLEVIRNLQCRLDAKCRRRGQGVVDGGDHSLGPTQSDMSQDDSLLPVLPSESTPSGVADAFEVQNQRELFSQSFPESELSSNNFDNLVLSPLESLDSSTSYMHAGNLQELLAHASEGGNKRRQFIPLENPKDMFARWEVNNLDLKNVVGDALRLGRLPLAVLQLHLQHLKDLATEKEPYDTFNEVQDVGRAIAYDLFCKGQIGLAVATLQRLGEDIEVSLKQLVFGTLRRSFRMQVSEEMNRRGFLGPYEWRILDRLSLIERLYPSSSFWGTYIGRQKQFNQVSSTVTLARENGLKLVCCYAYNNYCIKCGEVDGAVIGSWANIGEKSSVPEVDEDNVHSGYWAGAAVWTDAWDQTTVDRVVLDQPFIMGVHVLWESQLEYHSCHNDWEEVSKLLDMIPESLLSDGNLQINLDGLRAATVVGSNKKLPDNRKYFCLAKELDEMCMVIPNIKIFRFSASNKCPLWLRKLMELKLAKNFVFMKEYWEDTGEIVPLLAHAGFIINTSKITVKIESTENLPDLDYPYTSRGIHRDTVLALHKVFLLFCAQYNLPNFFDLYLDHHKLALDNASLGSILEAAGECQWAKWLLLSRIRGREYDASFSNARSIISHNMVLGSNIGVLEIDDIIRTVDDMAEGGGEIVALATLMYAPAPVQKCLCSGSVNRHWSSSAQCTLENLRPGLQQFPTLWHTLVAMCFGQDSDVSSLTPNTRTVFSKSPLSGYLNWRDNLFSSAGGDTSLLQMLPCWLSKAVRKLVQLFVQGPLGWQSLSGAIPAGESILRASIDFDVNSNENTKVNAISWEATIQKNIEQELYASSFEEKVFGIEHHLHRGRALAAFNYLLGLRAQKLKLAHGDQERSGASMRGLTNVHSEVQTLLAPLTQDEESLLSSVIPLAILHFEDSVLVASCAFLLELCGLPASIIHVDVAALRRISSFFKSSDSSEHLKHFMPNSPMLRAVSNEGDFTDSLARALADDYLHNNDLSIIKLKDTPLRASTSRRTSRALMAVLQHLEKVSLPSMVEGQTCGLWLRTGNGDGAELRSQQKAGSQHWNLVTVFCQMHHLPISTKYLALLANDDDWVGFLTEAQIEGCPFDLLIQVAYKEFTDPRLKRHILTVLKSVQSRKKAVSSTNSAPTGKNDGISVSTESEIMMPVELFGLLMQCEKQKNPGKALLLRAKDLRWSLLAMIASCFPDVSPLSCLTVWLEITAASETSSIKVNDISSQIAQNVGAAVEATNALPTSSRTVTFHYNRKNAKRRHLMEPTTGNAMANAPSYVSCTSNSIRFPISQEIVGDEEKKMQANEQINVLSDPDEQLGSLTKMVAVLCEQHLFLPLLRAFEMFLPSCSLLPFIRSLQAFSQMRLLEASAHLASFSSRIKEEPQHIPTNLAKDGQIGMTWISSTAVKAAEAVLSTCPSAYERRCLLQLLAAADFGDGGTASTSFRRLYWKINLAEPSLRQGDEFFLGNKPLDDAALLMALENNGHWEQARSWARQLELSGAQWKSVVHHVTETQAEAMVAEWKEFLWDVPEERAALWGHCQTLFLRYSFPSLQAGLFFLKHAEAVEKDIPARELHEILLLSLQWLSGSITQCHPVFPLHLLREIETRVWLLAVESEAQLKNEGDFISPNPNEDLASGNSSSMIEQTATVVTRMDIHLNSMRTKSTEKNDARESFQANVRNPQASDSSYLATASSSTKTKRRAKSYLPSRRPLVDSVDKNNDPDDNSSPPFRYFQSQQENVKLEASMSGWEERVGPAELERAVLSLLEFGQIAAAKQLQQKLSPTHVPSEFLLVDAALKLAAISTPSSSEISITILDPESLSVIKSHNILTDNHIIDPLQVLEVLATKCAKGSGRGLCKRIISVVKTANILGLSFAEAFEKRPIELLQLLSLKAQDSLEEAKLLMQTHSMPPASTARILAESFLKGLLAAHRGGYMDSQKEEGPAPLLWRFSDFLKWAELCPSEPEIGHALMRLVITGQEIPHACEVELLILSHHFYKSSACLDGVDVLIALAATRVESYVAEGDFSCLARLVTGVSNYRALNFMLGILIENGQLELLLQKYSVADTTTGSAESVQGFRMAVLTSLKHFNPHDLDAFSMVYNHFDMKHETSSLLESRSMRSLQQWLLRRDKERNEELLETMRFYIEAAEVYATIDAGNKTRWACAQASLISLQIRIPDFNWLSLSETNARRVLVEQSRFQEALIMAEAYGLNQPGEWAPVLWNQMLKPELIERFMAEFVAVYPLQPAMLMELARFYRAEVAARGDQSHFSAWLSPGGPPAEWARQVGKSFRSLLKRTRDLRVRMQLATVATGFGDIVDAFMKALDKVPDAAGPLVLRKGHGGAYLPLM